MIQPEVHVSYAVKDKQGRRFLTTHRDYDYSVTVFFFSFSLLLSSVKLSDTQSL